MSDAAPDPTDDSEDLDDWHFERTPEVQASLARARADVDAGRVAPLADVARKLGIELPTAPAADQPDKKAGRSGATRPGPG